MKGIIFMQDYIKQIDNVLVGERIRKLREQFNMSREKFSEIIDISEVFLGQIERGERSLSLKTLSKIVAYTGSSSDYILFGKLENTDTINKINNILNNCSSETVEYIYDLIHSSFTYLKKYNNI